MSASSKVGSSAPSAGWLTSIRAVASREVAAYFDSKIAYVYTIAFVLLANSIFMNEFFLTGTVDMTGFFDLMPTLLPFFLPAVTMRLWAEERKTRTIELLLTMPIRPIQAIVGKYLAALILYGLFLAGTLPIVLMLMALGDPDIGLITSGYLGLILLGGMFLALGMFISSLSSDQIVTFVSTVAVCALFVFLGSESVVAVLDGISGSWLIGAGLRDSISVMPHYDEMVRGVLSLSGILFFTGLSGLFLWVNAIVLERSRG